MLGEGVQQDTIAYSAAISACVIGVHFQQALGLFQRIWSDSVQRNTITYSASISICGTGEQWQQALELFARMRGECVPRNTYGKLILLHLLLPLGVSE